MTRTGREGRKVTVTEARMRKRGYRAHTTEASPRTRQEVYLSAEERLVIEVASGQEKLKPGAFIAAAAVRAARAAVGGRSEASGPGVGTGPEDSPVPLEISQARELLDEVRQVRRLMGNVAGNLNDVAKHANSTGELAPHTEAVLDFVRRTNERVDLELMRLLRRLR